MEKILSYPLSVVYYLVFGLLLVIFHPIQWICFNIFGYRAHKKSVDCLNFFLINTLLLLGTTAKAEGLSKIPTNVPVIFVANHQSLYDIIGFVWFFRRSHPKFVSKKELGKGIPSVSYNLRHGGSVLIDRKDPKQALPTIKGLAEYIVNYNRAAVIFPEGTRSKNGVPLPFALSGLKILCRFAPSSYIVPISINNSYKIVKYGFFPLGLGNQLTFTVHDPLAVKDYPFDELSKLTEQAIKNGVKI